RQPADQFGDLGFEHAGEFVEHLRAAHLAVALGGLFGGETLGLDHAVLEDANGRSHRADLVAASGTGDFAGYVAAGKPRHRGGKVDDRTADTAAHHHDQTDACGGYRNEDRERNQEAEARGGIIGAEDLL